MDIITEEEYEMTVRKEQSLAKFSKEKIIDSFGEAFELIGGVPRLALWAQEEPSKFYGLVARMATSNTLNVVQHQGPVVIRPSLPPTALDDE